MTLPEHNPIDTEWFARGIPIDHTGTQTRMCSACGKKTKHECFHVIVGSPVGFGAPVFVKPFLKRSSTKGKIGGTRGDVSQCTVCDSLWPMDLDGSAVLLKIGFDGNGMVHPTIAYRIQNETAKKTEKSRGKSAAPTAGSKVRKTKG